MTEPLCVKRGDAWAVLPYGLPVVSVEDIQASYDTVLLWPEGGEEWRAFGLARPDPAPDAPAGKVEASRALIDAAGRPAWSIGYIGAPTLALPDARAAKAHAVDALAASKMAAGYPHDFGGVYGLQVLQNRDADDRTNWLSVASTANLMIVSGRGDDPCGALRTAANVNVPVTAAQAAAVLVAMQAYLGGFLARAWALKDAITAAADAAAVDALDITAGWPA